MKREKKIGWTFAAYMASIKGDYANAAIASTPRGIEAQEQAGQKAFVNSETLPRKLNMGKDARETYEQMGITVIKEADDLFYQVSLPDGWHKVAENHSMWSKLVDDHGDERGSIFYKAAFYDRSAFFSVS